MLKESLEQLFEYVAKHIPSEQIMLAKEKYQKTTGGIYEDDKSYNTRMALFLEWYLLDNYAPETHRTILENIIEENPSSWTPDSLGIYTSISKNILALFEVRKVRENSVTVLDLLTDEKYQVDEKDSKLMFRKNDVFQGRVIPHQGNYFFSGYFCFHPNKTHRYIKGETKKILITQKEWEKELRKLEKELSKVQKSYLKNSKSIEKFKSKVERTDITAKLEYLNSELLILREIRAKIELSIQEIEDKISHLKLDKIKIEGRGLVSKLINKLAYMNLKWERSRQIDLSDIYKN
jgi:hypothetical protein